MRADILTGKYAAGEQIPSGPELTRRYGIAKATVARALDVLRDEGLIVTRKGKGSFVRRRTERPVELRLRVDAAFEADSVTVDFSGFSSETLHGAMREPLDKVRSGRRAPRRIAVRLLLPDTSVRMAVAVPADRSESRKPAVNHGHEIKGSVETLAELGLVPSASVEIRFFPASSLFELYVVNGVEAFFSYSLPHQRGMSVEGEEKDSHDIATMDTTLMHWEAGLFLQQSQQWFDSAWDNSSVAGAVGREEARETRSRGPRLGRRSDIT